MIEFINEYYKIISVFFGVNAALFIGFRVIGSMLSRYTDFVRREQRNEFQAGYFDLQESRYKWLVEKVVELEAKSKS